MANHAVRFIERCIVGFSYIVNSISAVLLGLMVLFVTADVLGRYFFNSPIKGDYEIIEVMTGIVISFSLAYALVIDHHIRIKIFTSRCSEKTQLISDIFAYFAGFLVFTVASWQTIVHANSLRGTGQLIGILPVPTYPFVYIMAISFISLSSVFLLKFIHSIAQRLKK